MQLKLLVVVRSGGTREEIEHLAQWFSWTLSGGDFASSRVNIFFSFNEEESWECAAKLFQHVNPTRFTFSRTKVMDKGWRSSEPIPAIRTWFSGYTEDHEVLVLVGNCYWFESFLGYFARNEDDGDTQIGPIASLFPGELYALDCSRPKGQWKMSSVKYVKQQ
ncbi:MAG: hypothetical protein PHS53_04640 [Candidatus Pacebacteria bacterium]|nr:hypothetical protein [Candidatus Paceibacterota bacterium]MDD5357406.1 hypothetical protein [Candidatus Paceibacterota bacterium]